MKQMSKIAKASRAATLDLWESRFYTEGSRVRSRRDAKRAFARAARRAARIEIREEL